MSKSSAQQKNTLDKFYTRPQVAEDCVMNIEKYIKIEEEDIFIEPSAGSGVFIDAVNEVFCEEFDILGYDLSPDREDIRQQDFTTFNLKKTFGDQPIHFVGNPPFGRSSSLCRKFIKKMCDYKNTKSISLILPISYHKQYNQDTSFNTKFHLVYEEILGKNSFTNEVQGKKLFDCPSVFQIWEKRDTDRETRKLTKPEGFKYVPNKEGLTADFCICHKGSAAGKIFDTHAHNSLGPLIQSSSYRFIKLDNPIPEIFDIYKQKAFQDLKFYDMGSPTINKPEINYEINKCIKYSQTLKKFDNMITMLLFIVKI